MEAAQEKSNGSKSQYITIGGVSTILIGVVNLMVEGQDVKGIVTTAMPIFVAGLFKFFSYLFVFSGFDDIDLLKSKRKLDGNIRFYEKRLAKAIKLNRTPEEIGELRKALLDAEKARGKVHDVISS
ncbi:hypothetical protein [Vibrio cholerae]|uniref:hypothetical protein n=1 Tax=Vibrio cholerae TaxID=666 RepID=UPI002D1F2E39|nr:hypothetical protein [Vibrio cholerae]EGR4501946.1 hypothetical protein [Vibrio cholerae]MEB3761762.1 hypothetical protein [Vibrio cholerae]